MSSHFRYILIIICFSFFQLSLLKAKEINVCKKCEVKSIKKAIAKAEDGDVICISNGIYKEENLIIDKALSLIGDGFPVIDGQNKYEVISIKANHVSLQNLKIIKIYGIQR